MIKNTILGVNNIYDSLQSLTGMINEGIKPSLIEYTQIKTEKLDDKDIIIIKIQSGPNKPYYLADKVLKSAECLCYGWMQLFL